VSRRSQTAHTIASWRTWKERISVNPAACHGKACVPEDIDAGLGYAAELVREGWIDLLPATSRPEGQAKPPVPPTRSAVCVVGGTGIQPVGTLATDVPAYVRRLGLSTRQLINPGAISLCEKELTFDDQNALPFHATSDREVFRLFFGESGI